MGSGPSRWEAGQAGRKAGQAGGKRARPVESGPGRWKAGQAEGKRARPREAGSAGGKRALPRESGPRRAEVNKMGQSGPRAKRTHSAVVVWLPIAADRCRSRPASHRAYIGRGTVARRRFASPRAEVFCVLFSAFCALAERTALASDGAFVPTIFLIRNLSEIYPKFIRPE